MSNGIGRFRVAKAIRITQSCLTVRSSSFSTDARRSFAHSVHVVSKRGSPLEIGGVLTKTTPSKEEGTQGRYVCARAGRLVHMQHELYVKYLTGTQLIQHMYTCKEYVVWYVR